MRFNPTFSTTVTADIQQSEQTLQQALQQVSTGKRVNLPSDDPAAAATLVQSLTESTSVDQYTANATTTLSQLQAADAALSSVGSLLNHAVTLGTEGANGSLTLSDQQSIAAEVQGVLTSVVSAANATYGGTALFGGTSGTSAAFQASGSSPATYTYQGNNGVNYVSVGDSLQVQTNIAGDSLFQKAGSSVIGSLEQLVSALNAGDPAAAGTATTEVTSALNYIASQQALYGSSISQINEQESYLAQEKITLTTTQSSLIDVDYATAAENLTQAETQNNSVLAAAAKVLPTSLLDYLK